MAHGRRGPDLVMNVRYVGKKDINAVSSHELNRTPDGASAIDPTRTHLNEVLHGPRTQAEAIQGMLDSGVKPPTKQADTPYVQIVLSASPEYFRDDLEAEGTWNEERLSKWKAATFDWLKTEYGEDLAHVSLHLDEDTPHMHVLVVPTYSKKPRKPGRQKKNETAEQFEARKLASQNGKMIRTISRSSNDIWSKQWARRDARISYFKVMRPLGIGYGKDFIGTGAASPEHKETGKWLREQIKEVKADRAELEKQVKAFESDRSRLVAVKKHLDRLGDELDQREEKLEKRERLVTTVMQRVQALAKSLADVIGLPLPKKMAEALSALEDGVSAYRDAMVTPSEDPFSLPSEDPSEETGSGLRF